FRVQKLAADIDLQLLARPDGHAREGDRARESGRERAARNFSITETRHDDPLVAAEHPAILQHEPDELARRALGFDGLQRLPANETPLAGLERDRPGETGLERMSLLIHVFSVKVHAGLEA